MQSGDMRRLFMRRLTSVLGLALAFLSTDATYATAGPASDPNNAIRPFHVKVSDETLADLKRRLGETRFPDSETVPDQSQGVQLATMKELVRYWRTEYDWRKAEAKLNALPQFMTTIEGVEIH